MTSPGLPTNDGPLSGYFDHLGWRTNRRPDARVGYVLGAAAGALLVVAAFAFVVEISSDDPTAPGVLVNLVLFAAAAVVGALVSGPVRSAAVTVMLLTTPLVWGFAFAGDGSGAKGDVRAILILSFVTYAVIYSVGWMRGRAVVLVAFLAFFSTWVVFEVDGSTSGVPFDTSIESNAPIPTPLIRTGPIETAGFPEPDDTPFTSEDSNPTDTGMTALLLGLAFLAIAAGLDRRRRAGMVTPFIGVGVVLAVVGSIILGIEEGTATGGILAVVTGATIGAVGGLGDDRRGSIWVATVVAFGGLIALCVEIAGDSTLAFAIAAALFAAATGVAAILIVGWTNEPDDDEPGRGFRRTPTGPII